MSGTSGRRLRFDRLGRHVRITFRKPAEGPPVVSLQTIAELQDTLTSLAKDAGVRSVTLRSEGDGVFLAGGDLQEFESLDTPEKGREMAEAMRAVLAGFEALHCPVIAALDGDVFGGGCEAILAADIRIAAPGVRLAFTQGRFGLIPGWGGATRLTRLVGRGRALLLLMTGRPVGAREAQAIGLVDRVVPRERLDDTLAELQANMEMIAPEAVRAAKEAVRKAVMLPFEQSLAHELDLFASLWASEAHREGLRAFFERRAPAWAGEVAPAGRGTRSRGGTERRRKVQA